LRLQESPTTTLQREGDSTDASKEKQNLVESWRESFNSIWSEGRLVDKTENLREGRHLGQFYKREEEHEHTQQQQQQQHSTLHAAFSSGAGTLEDWPQPEGIRLLVAVTSACCTQVSLQRRAAIRRTWGALVKERYPSGSISILFFLSQPENESTLTEWLPALEEEVIAHNDTVILRGKDVYLNLPNKTFRMLRYTLAHPREFSHVLKADDDTWVRMHKVLDYLHEEKSSTVNLMGAGSARKEGQASAPGDSSASSSSAAVITAAIQRKAELEQMSKERGAPIVSEGMALYDASSIVKRVDQDQMQATETVDDIDGSKLTLAELAKRSNWYANRARDGMIEAEVKKQKEKDVRFEGEKGAEEAEAGGKKRRQLLQEQKHSSSFPTFSTRPRMSGVYLGCIENQKGFQPIRDRNNKWYVSEEDLPDTAYPKNVKYLAGWSYLLSRDLIMHTVQKINSYESQPDQAPLWYTRIAFEDVLVGLLLHDVVPLPESHSGFRPAWRSCVPDTAVRHLDIDSPRLLKGLVEQDISGLADSKPVQCSSGQFLPGDYAGWNAWRTSLNT
jgi:Galactosyltransferase